MPWFVRKSDGALSALTAKRRKPDGTLENLGGTSGGSTSTSWTGMPRLKVVGNRITTPDSQPVMLRGVNMHRSEYIYPSAQGEDSFEMAAIPHLRNNWNCNVIMRGYPHVPVLENQTNYMAMLDRLVARCKANNIYLVLAARTYQPNGAFGDAYDQYEGIPPVAAEDGLKALALRYKNETHVMFAAQVEANNHGGYQPTWDDIHAYTIRCIDKIRSVSPDVIVMSSGTQFGRGIQGAAAKPIARTNVVYKAHHYPEVDADIQGHINTFIKPAVDAGRCVFIGEFGDYGLSTLLNYMNTNNIGGCAWGYDESGPSLLDGSNPPKATSTPNSHFGVPVRNWMLTTPKIPSPTTIVTPGVSVGSAKPPAAGYFTTQPVGFFPRSDAAAASMVNRSTWEPRPNNATANANAINHQPTRAGETMQNNDQAYLRVTGNFSGTTDEIIQWAAAKWGISDNLLRSVAYHESSWNQSAVGDNGESYGLTQVRGVSNAGGTPPHPNTFPQARDSTAFNLDYYGAMFRGTYNGWEGYGWLGPNYGPGDISGTLGRWFTGAWHTTNGDNYANAVLADVNNRPWLQAGF